MRKAPAQYELGFSTTNRHHADFGGKTSVDAARIAVEDFGGKVLGKPIEIVTADHQNKPDVATGIARRWEEKCEASFYVGQWHLLRRNIAKARPLLKAASRTCPEISSSTKLPSLS